ncbi:hypothetical protein HPP92_001070 [Vanilla planifolia]|uniref:Uncharacterized protein n=1 Tax=Vanilla planifolia TaxID=51239 RepID=A0A835S1U3_VANPL|nr:hypothetical protein HPP92_001070 [Vanilla planifolia]
MGMEMQSRASSPASLRTEEESDLRRGPWTVEEDLVLMNYIAKHGEGRWNSLARCAGLKRTGKSCRLRWLNYLRPDVRRGNITPEEQLLILELHSRWGNRWSKIAQHLPGRTDNEIKNYWRTRVQKHAKQLRCDVNSQQFKDIMRYLWMPRLVERIRAASGKPLEAEYRILGGGDHIFHSERIEHGSESSDSNWAVSPSAATETAEYRGDSICEEGSEGIRVGIPAQMDALWWPEASPQSPGVFAYHQGLPEAEQFWEGDMCESLWSMEDIWQQLQ